MSCAEMRKVVDEFPERVLIGEIYLPLERLVAYYGRDLDGAHLPFNFSLIETPWKAADIAALIGRYESLLPQGAWPNWVLGNHDRPRLATRVGPEQARVAAMLLLTLARDADALLRRRTRDAAGRYSAGRVRDPWGLERARRSAATAAARRCSGTARRTPDFPRATPWLPQSGDAETRNVEAQLADPASLLNLYRRLLALRRAHPALVSGGYSRVEADGDLLLIERKQGEERLLIALNLGGDPAVVMLPGDERGNRPVVGLAGPGRAGGR